MGFLSCQSNCDILRLISGHGGVLKHLRYHHPRLTLYLKVFYGSNSMKAIMFLVSEVSGSIKVQRWHAELSSGFKKNLS